MPQTHRDAQCAPGVVDRESPFDGELSGYNAKIPTVDQYVEHYWTVPRSLHAKGLFRSFQKRVGYRIRYQNKKQKNCEPFPHLFSGR